MVKYKSNRKSKRKNKRKTKRKSQLITQRLFPIGRQTIPDQLKVEMFYTHQFYTANNTACPAGEMAWYNVNGNVLPAPMATSGSGPTFQAYSAVVGAGTTGFGGTTSSDFGTGANPGFYAALLSLYNNYYVSGSKITVDIFPSSLFDGGDLYIVPVAPIQQNTGSAQNISESRNVKTKKIALNAFGIMSGDTLSHYASTRKVLGQKVSDDVLVQNNSYVGSGTVNPLAWLWQIGFVPRSSVTLAGFLTIRTRISYYVTWTNPSKLTT